jgi:hypothetical protein
MDTETLVRRINEWSRIENEVAKHLAEIHGIEIGQLNIQGAVMSVCHYDDPFDILGRDWTTDSLLEIVKDVNFKEWCKTEIISLDHSIIPQGVPRRLDEEIIKYHGEVWKIYKYDPDPFPSLPHAHCPYEGIKMDLKNGDLYKKQDCIGRIPKKDLIEFRNKVKHIELPKLEV